MDAPGPGWFALAIAVASGVFQVVTAFVQRPRERRLAENEAESRHDTLVRYVKDEFAAAQRQVAALKRGSIDTEGVDAKLLDVQSRMTVLEREHAHDRAQHELDRQANVAIQLDLREVVTTLKFLQQQDKGTKR